MKRAWEFLAAWWMHGETDANYPAVPGGQVPTLQSDGTVIWAAAPGGPGGEILVDDETGEILVDDATGNVLYDG